ncbi:ABC transporter substrate-binding protein, partial [Immundisolibacter sp.]|uniref:ABC transporter substrate-binding protein n=1 Tax=Immundisolibacter sp. TaxID=1934948 RepID=UPI00262B04B6
MSPNQPSPELSRVRLGYIPLTDAAPLVVALERGYFARYGLDVTLVRQPSWATLRDKLLVGHLDGAHLLAPMALACALGVEGVPQRLVAALSLGLGGNAITVADNLYRELQAVAGSEPVTVKTLARLIARRRAAG